MFYSKLITQTGLILALSFGASALSTADYEITSLPVAWAKYISVIPAGTHTLIYDYSDRQFKLLKGPKSRGQIRDALKKKQFNLLSYGASLHPDAKVRFFVANINLSKHKVKVEITKPEVLDSAEKMPDLLKGVLDGSGDAAKATTENMKGVTAEKTGRFFDLTNGMLLRSNEIQSRSKVAIKFSMALTTADIYPEDTKDFGTKPTSKELVDLQKSFDLYQTDLKTLKKEFPEAGISELLENQIEILEGSIKAYKDALGVSNSYDSGELFLKSFLQKEPNEIPRTAAMIKITVDEVLLDDMEFRQNATEPIIRYSVGFTFAKNEDRSYGLDTDNKIIEKGTKSDSKIGTTAFAHAMFGRNGRNEYGLSVGVSQGGDNLSYFLGGTMSFGSASKFYLTAGFAWIPASGLASGYAIGDTITGNNIPTATYTKQSLFFALTFKF